MKKVRFHTLGCKTNQYDSEAMLEQLKADGYTLAGEGEAADLVIVNTCTVTAEADRKSRQMLRQAVGASPDALVVAAGCFAQKDASAAAAIPGVDLVLGNQDRGRIAELIRELEKGREPVNRVASLKGACYEPLTVTESGEHTRANIKIQEGCNRYCSYCIIPYVRGPIRSRPVRDTVEEVAGLAGKGIREFILTGIHIASYGLDQPDKPELIDLLEALDPVPGVERVRLGSVEPSLLSEEFCRRAAGLRHLCPHFHISLQSGCTATLKRMNRKYTAEEFTGFTENLRKYIPEAALTTDVIVGFPGETEADFEESLAFVRKIGFSRIHVFPYSPREGTPAAVMPGQITKAEKHDRALKMIALGEELLHAAQERKLGRTETVLLEEETTDGISGYTPDYTRVLLPAGSGLQGEIVPCRLESIRGDAVAGQRI